MNFWKDYLREVFRAFWQALERTDTLLIGVLIVAGIGTVWFGGHAEHPSWQIAFAVFLVSLFVLLVRMSYRLYAEQRATIHSLTQRLTPKIGLSFHPDTEGLSRTPIALSHRSFGSPQTVTPEPMATCVRIRAEALSDTTVTGCKVFLTKLQREHADGKTVSEIPLPHSVSLRDGLPFDVYPKVVQTFDILWCTSENNKLVVPECTWPNPIRDVFDETGTYHFTIMVNAGDISDAITVAVAWPGQWDKITARQVYP